MSEVVSEKLVKGQKFNLTKGAGGAITKLLIGLGWDAKDSNVAGAEFDLDASIFAVHSVGGVDKAMSAKHFVFWGNYDSPDGSIHHHGDNLTGAGDGDDEQITVDVTKLPPETEKLIVAVTIYEAADRKQNFGMVSNAIVRAETDGVERSNFALDFESALATCVVPCTLVKRGGEWIFDATPQEFEGGLEGLCVKYGLNIGAGNVVTLV